MSAKTDLEQAANEAVSVIASAAAEAAKVVAAATSEALKIVNLKNGDDHDILIEVRTEMRGIKSDIKELKDGTTRQLADHELRITSGENLRGRLTILTSLGVALLTLLSGLMFYHMIK